MMEMELIKILIVDDDPADRRLAELALKRASEAEDFSIDTAGSLGHAIEMLGANSYDIVLLDLGLPDSQGVATVSKLSDEFPKTPIIVLTGLDNDEVGAEAIRNGAVDYVTKPVTPEEIKTRITIALQIADLQKRLVGLANTDELTGLANRRSFFDMLEREILRVKIEGKSLGLMMLDLDHFKNVNDTYGHLAGDSILKQLGRLLQENIYPLDVAGRYGGEEFVVLMPSTSSENSLIATNKIHSAINEFDWKLEDMPLSVTASIGLANMDPSNILDSNSLVEKADAALYTAKQKGRNCVVCWDDRRPFCAVAKPNPEVSSFNDLREKIFSLTKKLEDQVMGTVSAFIKTMEISLDDPKAGHLAEKVKIYAERIAEEMNLGEELKERIRTAALVKDLGHISVPQNILRKAEPLSDEEIRIFQQHPVATARILEPIGIFDSELQIIKHHHERFDGSGYPSGLKGKEIMIGARVLAVADEFVELCVGGLDMEAALEEMRKGSGSKFDPDVVEAFVKAFEKNSDKWETEAVSMAVIASG